MEKKAGAAGATFPWLWFVLVLIVACAIAYLVYLVLVTVPERQRVLAEREATVERERLAREEAGARERELTQNPVTSGPPIVAGGIPATDTTRLAAHFHDRAVADYTSRNPGADTARIERIGPVEEGMISGEGPIGYADNPRVRRIDPPLPGYRARFRFPDGREELLMSLQGCMNPCFYGEGMGTGFTFTPGRVAVPAPEPPQAGPQAVPHPTMVARSIRTAAEGEGRSTVTIGDQVMTFDRGVHFVVDQATGHITVSGIAVEMTVKPKAAAPATTATDATAARA